jgi:hypothetical protein
MIAALRAPAMAETAPTPAVEAAPEPVAETDEQRITRLVQEGVRAMLPAAVQEHVQTNGLPSRRGLVNRRVTETAPDQELTDQGVPADWPQKPLSQYSEEERRRYVAPALQQHVLGTRP